MEVSLYQNVTHVASSPAPSRVLVAHLKPQKHGLKSPHSCQHFQLLPELSIKLCLQHSMASVAYVSNFLHKLVQKFMNLMVRSSATTLPLDPDILIFYCWQDFLSV